MKNDLIYHTHNHFVPFPCLLFVFVSIHSTLQLQNAFNNAVSSGALTKALYVLSGSSKMKFFMGAPTAGLAAPLLKPTQGIKGSVEGSITADVGTDDVTASASSSSNDDKSSPEFAYAPSTDDGNAPTTDDYAASGAPPSTDDGGASGSFRHLEEQGFFEEEDSELAPFESTEVDVIGERPSMGSETQRNLKGVLVSVSPIPTRLSTSFVIMITSLVYIVYITSH